MVLVTYIAVFLLTFFVASIVVTRFGCDDPTSPDTFLPLVAFALVWPVTVPVTAVIFILVCIAKLAIKLSGGIE